MNKGWSSSASPLFKGSIDSERKSQVESIPSPPGPMPVTKTIENDQRYKDLGIKVALRLKLGHLGHNLGWRVNKCRFSKNNKRSTFLPFLWSSSVQTSFFFKSSTRTVKAVDLISRAIQLPFKLSFTD